MTGRKDPFRDLLAASGTDGFPFALFRAGRRLGDGECQIMAQSRIEFINDITAAAAGTFLVSVFRTGHFFLIVFDIMTQSFDRSPVRIIAPGTGISSDTVFYAGGFFGDSGSVVMAQSFWIASICISAS